VGAGPPVRVDFIGDSIADGGRERFGHALIAQAWLRAVTPGDLTAGLIPPARVPAVTLAI
jgi:hypothetical protein